MMCSHSKLLTAALVLGIAGCSNSDSGGTKPSPTYDQIAGDYAGPVSGVSLSVALNATLTSTLTQYASELGGRYSLDATLTDGGTSVQVPSSGTFTGSIDAGNNPSVHLTLVPNNCPNTTADFSGTYDSANHSLTMTGPVIIEGTSCGPAYTFQVTFVLNAQ